MIDRPEKTALYLTQVALLRCETPVSWNHKTRDKVGTPRKTDLTESLKCHICTKKKTTHRQQDLLYYSLLYLKVRLEFQNIGEAGTVCDGRCRPEVKKENNNNIQ